jgi:6-pyruvoyl-tetrahydropterin synthase
VFETGTSLFVRSFHIMPGAPPPEGVRHSHDYRIDVVVGRERLDERGMVVDLDVLHAELRRLGDVLDGADLDEVVRPPDAGAVTVEVFAEWFHDRLLEGLDAAGGSGCDSLAVRVYENEVAFGGYRSSAPARSTPLAAGSTASAATTSSGATMP